MSRAGERDDDAPRAIVHKRILDIARGNPESSLEELAAEVPAATPDLVDRVLAEYGDPAAPATDDTPLETQAMSQNGTNDATAEERDGNAKNGGEPSPPEATQLTQKQRETLAAVRDRPTASQAEIADDLGVTSATVSRRLNDVQGFDWTERAGFAERHLGPTESDPVPSEGDDQDAIASEEDDQDGIASERDDQDGIASEDDDQDEGDQGQTGTSPIPTETDSGESAASDDGGNSTDSADLQAHEDSLEDPTGNRDAAGPNDPREVADSSSETDTASPGEDAQADQSLAELESRIGAIEERLAGLPDSDGADDLDPELVHKVAHACLESDAVSRDEELTVLKHLMR